MKDYNEMAESVFERRDKYYAERRMAMNKFKKGTTGVVCCCLVALFAAGVFSGNQTTTNDTPNIGIQDYNENKLETSKEEVGNEQVNNYTPNIEDSPADENGTYNENVNVNDLVGGTAEFFGGSYTDDNGKFVIVLIDDTPENRTAICKELGVDENTTLFEVGTYTHEYLTELQSKISSAMVNKEFPFVTSSGVYEAINRIKVRVTTDNEADLKRVLALDTIGGAIVIEHSAGVVTEELVITK